MKDHKHEVEFRALISRDIFDKFLAEARDSTKKTIKPLSIIDAYYCAKSVTSFKEIEMDKVGSYSLRLRCEQDSDKENSSMNTKVIQSEGDHNAWLEHQINISSFSEAERILNSIGFKKFFELSKKRYSFHDHGVEVCLEDIHDFQPAIEVEMMTTHDNIEKAKNDLIIFLDKHGIKKDMIVKKSITNILMREKSRF